MIFGSPPPPKEHDPPRLGVSCGAWAAGCRHGLGVRSVGDFVHNPLAAYELVVRQRDAAQAPFQVNKGRGGQSVEKGAGGPVGGGAVGG